MLEAHLHTGNMNYMKFLPCYVHLAYLHGFITLSAADLHWIEMIEAVSIHNQKPMTRNEIHKMSIKERSEKLKLTLSHLLECSI